MARATKAAAKPKKKATRSKRRVSLFELMPTNTWFKAMHFVHYEIESKDWVSKIKEYITKNFDKETVRSVNKLPDWNLMQSHYATIAELSEVKPNLIPVAYNGKIDSWIKQLAEKGAKIVEEKKAEEKTKKNVYVPSIQERIAEQAQSACEDIEEWLDSSISLKDKFDPKGFNFVGHFAKHKVTQAHARKIKKYYQFEFEEAQLIQKIPTASEIKKIKNEQKQDFALQLKEAYSHVSKTDAKKYMQGLENLIGACDVVIETSKANRKPRKKAPVSKEKQIAKLKYKDKDDKYQIVSINPVDVVGAQEVWVFNIKTRKIGKYVAEEGQTFKVKGTTLLFFDEKLSVQKNLRKPEEQLKEFKKLGKVKLRTYLDTINAVEIKLNGRFNADTVILKAF